MTSQTASFARPVFPATLFSQPFSRYTVFDEQRAALVEALRARGVRDERVLEAIGAVPRELFIHEALAQGAYADSALPIGCKQTISQPYTVAFMTLLLGVRPGSKILEIGTGSGYQAAVLARMGARVFSVERFEELRQKAEALFERLNLKVVTRLGDGTLGWREEAPFDGIIVTAGAPDAPPALLEQLSVGGRLIIPVGSRAVQTLYRIVKTGENAYETTDCHTFRFVPLVGKEGWGEQ